MLFSFVSLSFFFFSLSFFILFLFFFLFSISFFFNIFFCLFHYFIDWMLFCVYIKVLGSSVYVNFDIIFMFFLCLFVWVLVGGLVCFFFCFFLFCFFGGYLFLVQNKVKFSGKVAVMSEEMKCWLFIPNSNSILSKIPLWFFFSSTIRIYMHNYWKKIASNFQMEVLEFIWRQCIILRLRWIHSHVIFSSYLYTFQPVRMVCASTRDVTRTW